MIKSNVTIALVKVENCPNWEIERAFDFIYQRFLTTFKGDVQKELL